MLTITPPPHLTGCYDEPGIPADHARLSSCWSLDFFDSLTEKKNGGSKNTFWVSFFVSRLAGPAAETNHVAQPNETAQLVWGESFLEFWAPSADF